MKHALLVLCLGSLAAGRPPGLPQGRDLAPLPVDGTLEELGPARAFVELSASRSEVFVHEPFVVRLRVGLEHGFLAASLIQLFRRPLDVPAQLQADWLGGLPCARLRPPEPGALGPGARGASLALEGRVVEARRLEDLELDGRRYAVLELERSYLPTCPGELELSAPLLRCAYATAFDEDLLLGRTPLDRRDAFVRGRPVVLSVRPLPEQGRPPGFTGAVGRFSVHAEAAPRELTLGQGLRLELSIEGQGDLGHFAAPRLEPLAGFQVRGWIETPDATRRVFTYDLAPRHAGVREVPPIPFSSFDPGPPAGYRTTHTQPIPVVVHGPAPDAVARPDAGGAAATERSSPAADAGPRRVLPWLLAGSALLALSALGLALRRRARASARDDPQRDRLRAAAARFHARAQRPDADTTSAFAEFLAARLGCPVPSVLAHGLRARLRAAGVPDELAQRVEGLMDALVAARYGGPAAHQAEAAARALVDELSG